MKHATEHNTEQLLQSIRRAGQARQFVEISRETFEEFADEKHGELVMSGHGTSIFCDENPGSVLHNRLCGFSTRMYKGRFFVTYENFIDFRANPLTPPTGVRLEILLLMAIEEIGHDLEKIWPGMDTALLRKVKWLKITQSAILLAEDRIETETARMPSLLHLTVRSALPENPSAADQIEYENTQTYADTPEGLEAAIAHSQSIIADMRDNPEEFDDLPITKIDIARMEFDPEKQCYRQDVTVFIHEF